MQRLASEPPAGRAQLFLETAVRQGLTPQIAEKDFWVCWMLSRLFPADETAPLMIFKGGTSLSKAYHLIRRFSEDIDLSLDRHALGFREDRDPENATGNKAKRLLVELADACVEHVSSVLLPRIRTDVSAALGDSTDWSIVVDPEDPQTILFTYPPSLKNPPGAYVAPAVRLEFGARSDLWPCTTLPVRPYVAEEFPDVFDAPTCQVPVLEAKRTFWEKATLLHAEYHRAPPRVRGDRLSRHYYDMAMLSDSDTYQEALADMHLLEAVAKHKRRFFPSAWARYEEARAGTLRLSPHATLTTLLERDYTKMREMIFDEPPSFDWILERIALVEADINSR